MSMQMKTSLKLSQQLRMTPQLQQAIKLLQLSRLELETAIRKELDENPVLEESHEAPEATAQEASESSEAADTAATGAESSDPRQNEEFEWESYFENQNKPPQNLLSQGEDVMNYENIISASTSLHEHLMWQMSLGGFNEDEQNLMSLLISYVEDDGYIKTPIEQISQDEGVPTEELTEMIPFLQEFDPAGVGARDLKECLLIQAKHLEEDTHEVVHLIENHIKDLEKKNYGAIAKAMNRPLEEIVEICKMILQMDPKPGLMYMPQDTQFVTPDVYVYKVGDQYVVSLNEDGLPRLRISNLYRSLLKEDKAGGTEKTQAYIQDKLRSAVWLIKSIHQRQRTIYKVTESIVRYQQDFFEKGPAFIRPMILRDIANDIGMHESTVSRVTTNKYVHTPRGIFELKYFFNSGINKTDGDSLASESVKLKIKALISAEDPKDPLSDQKIVELLEKDGIQIARRTVAKYREMLRILPSSKRKKIF